MDKFIPKAKMSKKAKKRIAAEQRGIWAFSPVIRKIDSKKLYNRKKSLAPDTMKAREILFCFLAHFFLGDELVHGITSFLEVVPPLS